MNSRYGTKIGKARRTTVRRTLPASGWSQPISVPPRSAYVRNVSPLGIVREQDVAGALALFNRSAQEVSEESDGWTAMDLMDYRGW